MYNCIMLPRIIESMTGVVEFVCRIQRLKWLDLCSQSSAAPASHLIVFIKACQFHLKELVNNLCLSCITDVKGRNA